jgi:intein-encoded DNA endonuclease-like protein
VGQAALRQVEQYVQHLTRFRRGELKKVALNIQINLSEPDGCYDSFKKSDLKMTSKFQQNIDLYGAATE